MQVAISALLLVPTGLFLKSLVNLLHVDLGSKDRKGHHVSASRRKPNSYKPEQSRALLERVEEQMASIPGVRSVTASMVPLIAGSNSSTNLTVEGFGQGPGVDTH